MSFERNGLPSLQTNWLQPLYLDKLIDSLKAACIDTVSIILPAGEKQNPLISMAN